MPDTATTRIVAIGLVLVALLGLAETAHLLANNVDAASVALVSGLTGTSIGALASLLASTRTAPKEV